MQKLLGGFEPQKSQEIADMLRAIAKEAQRAYKRVQREMRDLKREWDIEGLSGLSNHARELKETRNRCNHLAENIHFYNLSPYYFHVIPSEDPHRTMDQIDLHNLNVREALDRTWDHVLFCQIQGREVTEVVCARGNNSKNGVPRLRSAVLTALRCAKNVKGTVHKRNPGRLVAQILNGYSVPAVFKETVVGKNVNVKASNEETLTHQDDT